MCKSTKVTVVFECSPSMIHISRHINYYDDMYHNPFCFKLRKYSRKPIDNTVKSLLIFFHFS